jgi:hypothetical protein
MDCTINGLIDGVSILETNKNELPSIESDILYNDKETDFVGLYYDEGYTVSNIDSSSFVEGIILTSICEETISNITSDE